MDSDKLGRGHEGDKVNIDSVDIILRLEMVGDNWERFDLLKMNANIFFDEIEIEEQKLKKQKLIGYLKKFVDYLEKEASE